MRSSLLSFALFFLLALVPFVAAVEWCDEGTNQQILFHSLNSLYLNTETDTWRYDYLWGTTECPCSWYGVDCGTNNTETTISLNLDDNGIFGSVPDDFCAEIYSFINLSNNNFFGVLADCVTKIDSLHTLRLQNNEFQGLLPAGAENLNNLDIRDNSFAGPLPTFISCPGAYSGNVKYSHNDFWCTSNCPVDDSDSDDVACESCAPEPSPACTTLNTIACGGELACCYESTWNAACDDIVDKESDTECEEPSVCVVESPSTTGGLPLWEILTICAFFLIVVIIVFAIGWIGTCYVTFSKRQWSFKEVKPFLIHEEDDNSLMEGLDEDLYYDGVPPRSSLDFEL